MIITVTLNAAIDKSLSVPNFRLGRRHRTVEQTTLPGGKGVNVARTLKTLGQPVIATGFAGGATGTRIVEALTDESILNDFVRIREESRTNTAVLDPTNGEQTEINERGPAVSERELELFRDKLCTSRAARRSSSSPARCRAASTPTSTRTSSRSCASSASSSSSTPTATRCATPCAPSRTSSRRTCSRPRSSSATSSTTTRTASSPCARWSRSARRRRS